MDLFRPTLWRTCRTLANAKRLRCLKAVLAEPAMTVGEIAGRAVVAENHACECLRALQARGLLEARRQSRWVRYVPVPDPLVPSARPMLFALRKALLVEKRTEAELIHLLTAFTHPRRLAILTQLRVARAVAFEDLAELSRLRSPTIASRTDGSFQ